MRRAIAVALSIAWSLAAAVPLALSLVLVGAAETARGRLFGLTATALLSLPLSVAFAFAKPSRARALLSASLLVAFATGWVTLYRLAPDGAPLPASPLRSDFLGEVRYPRGSLASLLPEIDQVALGTRIVFLVDPLIDRAEAAHIREASMKWYRPMEADPEFAALGSVMSFAYADRDAHHVYAYAPPHAPTERLPAIVFLHGSAGNFKAYFYLWKRFADENDVAIVCPSFGFGNWYEPGGTDAIERARQYAVDRLDADESRIVLAGLSNGGTGVTRAAAEHPERWAGLVFVSAVVERRVVTQPSFALGFEHKRILVVHGTADDRIPVDGVVSIADEMRGAGADVDVLTVEHEDHFLFFDRPEIVLDRVRAWMTPTRAR